MPRSTERKRSDLEWVQQLRGDHGRDVQEDAYVDLGKRLHRSLYNLLLQRRYSIRGLQRYDANSLLDLAEELTQTTLEQVSSKRLYAQYTGDRDAKFTTYITRVAINVAKQVLRRREWTVLFEPLLGYGIHQDGGDESHEETIADSSGLPPETQHEVQEFFDALRDCWFRLPVHYREALYLKTVEDLPTKIVVERMEAPNRQNVDNWVFRARGALRKCLTENGWPTVEMWDLFS